MAKLFSSPYAWFALAFLLAGSALISRSFIYMNLDNAALLYEAYRVHGGEILNKDFIEINPPLIVYLMLVPVYIHEHLHIILTDSFTIFIALVSLISLLLALPRANNPVVKIFLVILIFYPLGNNFGQREHLYIILILPYFISLWDKNNPASNYQIISGLMAGIGFCIKPYFAIVWLGLVFFKMLADKKFFSVFSVQNIIIGILIVSYAAFLVFVEKEYIIHIVPFLFKYYNLYSNTSAVHDVVIRDLVLYQTSLCVVFFVNRELLTRSIYASACAFLFSLLVVLVQNRAFVYYLYPISFFGALTNILILLALRNNYRPLYNKVAIIFAMIVLTVYFYMIIITNLDKTDLIFEDNDNARIIGIYDKYANGKPVYFLGTGFGHVIYPALIYSQAFIKPYYGTMWPLFDMYRSQPQRENLEYIYRTPENRGTDEAVFVGNVMSDLRNNPPEIIIVEDNNPKIWGFDYLHYFLQEAEFREIWKNYRLLEKIGDQNVYVKKDVQ